MPARLLVDLVDRVEPVLDLAVARRDELPPAFPQGETARALDDHVVPPGHAVAEERTSPRGREWFEGQLRRLVEVYGVDGFKLDGGATPSTAPRRRCSPGRSPSRPRPRPTGTRGRRRGYGGTVVVGPASLEVEAPLERLPWYRRIPS